MSPSTAWPKAMLCIVSPGRTWPSLLLFIASPGTMDLPLHLCIPAHAALHPHAGTIHQEREAKLALPELEPTDAIFEKTATKEEQRRVVRALPTTDATPPAAARPCTAHRTEPSRAGL